MQHPTVTLNPCDDGASVSTRERQHLFQPEHKCVSIRRVYSPLKQESRPPRRAGLGRFTFIKKHCCSSTSRDLSNCKRLWILISAPCCECSSSKQLVGGVKRSGRRHMPQPSLLLSRLLKVSSVNILTSVGVSGIYPHRQSFLTFPDLPWIAFCVAAPQLFLM